MIIIRNIIVVVNGVSGYTTAIQTEVGVLVAAR